jgi:carbamate kinase
MRPKVEAAVDFARAGGETLITSAAALEQALAGDAGTRITK